jgi:amino acid permease
MSIFALLLVLAASLAKVAPLEQEQDKGADNLASSNDRFLSALERNPSRADATTVSGDSEAEQNPSSQLRVDARDFLSPLGRSRDDAEDQALQHQEQGSKADTRAPTGDPTYSSFFVPRIFLTTGLGHCKENIHRVKGVGGVFCGEPSLDRWRSWNKSKKGLDVTELVLSAVYVISTTVAVVSWMRHANRNARHVRLPMFVVVITLCCFLGSLLLLLPSVFEAFDIFIHVCTVQQILHVVHFLLLPMLTITQMLRVNRWIRLQALEQAKHEFALDNSPPLTQVMLQNDSQVAKRMYNQAQTTSQLVDLGILSLSLAALGGYVATWCTVWSCQFTGFGIGMMTMIHCFVYIVGLLVQLIKLGPKNGIFFVKREQRLCMCMQLGLGVMQVLIFVSQNGLDSDTPTYNFMLFDPYRICASLILFALSMLTLFFATVSDSKKDMMEYISEPSDTEKFPLSTLMPYFQKREKKEALLESLHSSFQLQLWLFWRDMEAIGSASEESQKMQKTGMEAAQLALELYIVEGSPLSLKLPQQDRDAVCERILFYTSQSQEPSPAQLRHAFRPAELLVHRRLAVLVYTAPVSDEHSSFNIVELILPQPNRHKRSDKTVDQADEATMGVGGGVWSITCQIIGSRIVTIPYYLALCGWSLGFGLLVVFALLSFSTLLLEYKLSSIVEVESLPALADRAFGAFGWYVANAAILLLNLGGFVGRLLILGSSTPELLRALSITDGTEFTEHRQIALLTVGLGCLPFALMRDLRRLSVLGLISFFLILCMIATVVYTTLITAATIHSDAYRTESLRHWPTKGNAPSTNFIHALGGFMYMFTCQDVAFPIQAQLKDKSKFGQVAFVGLAACISAFAIIGCCAAVLFKTDNLGNSNFLELFDGLRLDRMANLCRFFMAFAVLVSIPVAMYMPRVALMTMLLSSPPSGTAPPTDGTPEKPKKESAVINHSITIALLGFAMSVAMLTDSLGHVFNIVGGIAGTIITLLIPCGAWLRLATREQWSSYNTVMSCCCFAILLGLFAMAVSMVHLK